MNDNNIELNIQKWCKKYSNSPVTDYSEDKEVFRDSIVYDNEEVHVIRMEDTNRIELAIASTPLLGEMVEKVGKEQWKKLITELAAQHGPVDVTFFDDDELEGYNLVDYIYDDSFSIDLLHQRCRRLIAAAKVIDKKLEFL